MTFHKRIDELKREVTMKIRMSRSIALLFVLAAVLSITAVDTYAQMFTLPGVIPPSACRVGAVVSTEQFTTTGFSNVRTANPDDQIVAGAWVVANNHVPDTSIIFPPNCETATLGDSHDDQALNLMAVRLVPTIASAAEADITEVMLVWDVNVNGLWDPLLDLVLKTQPGSNLDTQDGAVFHNGPQAPIAVLANTTTPANPLEQSCIVGTPDTPAAIGLSPDAGNYTNSDSNDENGCFIALLAVVKVGSNPTTGSQFGLELEALAGDIPGTTGATSATFSSGFSSSRNPQAANVRLHMVGGTPSSHTPLEHISNGSGNPESAVRPITFTGGQAGEGLLTRFRAQEINPGTREAIAMAVGVCDGAELANTVASILPAIAGASPTIAGGLSSLPCIDSAGTDGLSTGINGATLVFRGPLARYMGTVRMYVDECSTAGDPDAGDEGISDQCNVDSNAATPFNVAPTLSTLSGGGDGFLFQAGELVEQVVPIFNEQTGEAIAQFGGRQEQILFTGNGNPVAHGSDPICQAVIANVCGDGTNADAGETPLLILWTVDIDQNAPGGIVDVLLGLQTFDDTALNRATTGAPANPCVAFATNNTFPPLSPVGGGVAGDEGACASNFLNIGPEMYSFTVEGPEHPSTPNNLAAFDTNNSCFIDDPEFFAAIDAWVDGQIGDDLFFDLVDAWVGQENICGAASAGVSALSLDGVSLDGSFGTMTFSVAGQGIEGMGVNIFSLSGDVVFSQETNGTSLSWNQMTSAGAPVANGTYLYVVTVEGADGQTLTSEVNKLAVVR